MVDWRQFETILLDMDGTLLDLAFDNYFWRELVPQRLARAQQISYEQASVDLSERYAEVYGSLDWYCLDFWSAELGLDLRALKVASSHRIRYLPGAHKFLVTLAGWRKRTILVTNAHGDALNVKKEVVGLDRYVDEFVSSHELGFAKEHSEFWPLLHERIGFNPESTLFVDDSLPVLDAAAAYGLRGIVAVSGPDTQLPDNDTGSHASVRRIVQLLQGRAISG
ncbi:MAG: GMP/IMP nucleotidase [Gammaproteobacteria bacterium]|jgi:putative hydrolase of the HAD superfamily|nr:GMP/IMP nucleotidase [Gammaproteobacteria bacterium]MDP6674696.1 GMP/IMP nucleotidase [Gammaproteobacteria bacterium]